MLHFEQLEITPDDKCLIADIAVDDIDYFDNVKIDKVLIDSQDTFLESGPSSDAVLVYSQTFTDFDIRQDGNHRHIRLVIQPPTLPLSTHKMYFVYAIADVSESPEALEAPCGMCDELIMGTVVNLCVIYKSLMNGIREVADSCNISKNFIDLYLRYQAVETNIRAGNYRLAINYWEQFFRNNVLNNISQSRCRCHG